MQLLGKTILMVAVDGIDREEVLQLKRGFEEEGALVLSTTPQPYIVVSMAAGEEKKRELVVDVPFEAVAEYEFEGLLLPDGVEKAGEEEFPLVVKLVDSFYRRRKPIFASGGSSRFLREAGALPPSVVVREGTAIEGFLEQAVEALSDYPSQAFAYRATKAL